MRIGILSDVHEDVLLLEKALLLMEKERCDQVISLGDILGVDNGHYGQAVVRDAEACIRMIRENCSLSLAGNHDLFALRKIPAFTAGFNYPSGWYTLPLAERRAMGKGKLWDYSPAEEQVKLTDASLDYLSSLPEYAVATIGGIPMLFSHHLYPDLSGSLRKMPIWPSDIWSHLKFIKRHGCQSSITGHTHVEGTLTGNWFHIHTTLETSFFIGTRRNWMTCLPVTRGGVSSGFMIFIPETGQVTIHHL